MHPIQKIVLSLTGLLLAVSAFGQNRLQRPYQLQLNAAGVFIKAFGSSLAERDVKDLDVFDWALPGVTIGFHANRHCYFGFSYQPSRRLRFRESWGFTEAVNDLDITLSHETGTFYNLEFRYSPFRSGWYAGLFFTHNPETVYRMDIRPVEEVFSVGENNYDGEWLALWDFKRVNTLGVQLGFNWIWTSGLSLNIGLGIPLVPEPYYENVRIRSVNQIGQLSPEDLALAEERILQTSFYYPIQLQLGLGFNFTR
ncbi:MAG: hypothetical protein AAGG75_27290 [Bacteroidota bacterium]